MVERPARLALGTAGNAQPHVATNAVPMTRIAERVQETAENATHVAMANAAIRRVARTVLRIAVDAWRVETDNVRVTKRAIHALSTVVCVWAAAMVFVTKVRVVLIVQKTAVSV